MLTVCAMGAKRLRSGLNGESEPERLGMVQSVLRYILLPLMFTGVIIGLRLDWRTTGLVLATVFYYLAVGSMMHTHIRYGLPMHALLTIFAGLACWRTKEFVVSRKLSSFTVSEARL